LVRFSTSCVSEPVKLSIDCFETTLMVIDRGLKLISTSENVLNNLIS